MMWNDHERVLNQQALTWALTLPNFSYLCVRSPDLPMVHDKPFFFFGAYKVWHSVFLEHSTGARPVVWRCKVLLIYWHKLRLSAQVLWRIFFIVWQRVKFAITLQCSGRDAVLKGNVDVGRLCRRHGCSGGVAQSCWLNGGFEMWVIDSDQDVLNC